MNSELEKNTMKIIRTAAVAVFAAASLVGATSAQAVLFPPPSPVGNNIIYNRGTQGFGVVWTNPPKKTYDEVVLPGKRTLKNNAAGIYVGPAPVSGAYHNWCAFYQYHWSTGWGPKYYILLGEKTWLMVGENKSVGVGVYPQSAADQKCTGVGQS